MSKILDEFIQTLNSKSAKKSYRLSLEKFFRYFYDQDILKLEDSTIIGESSMVSPADFNSVNDTLLKVYI